MGQAFNRDGELLGEAYGDSKREVFEKLIEQFKDAHEIRVKSMGGAALEMPRYKCHKEVYALKIRRVIDPSPPDSDSTGSRVLTFESKEYQPLIVTPAYVRKHDPQAGGYYVVYQDGYASFSPAKAFEEGYTRI